MEYKKFKVSTFSLKIKLPQEPDTAFDNIIKNLAEARFKMKVLSNFSAEMKKVERIIPRLLFQDEEGEANMSLSKEGLELDIGIGRLRRESMIKMTTSKSEEEEKDYFSETSLRELNSEINYIIGLIIGQAGSTKKLQIEGDIELEMSDTEFLLNHLLAKKVLLSKTYDTHLVGLQFKTSEELWDGKADLDFRLLQEKDYASGEVYFSFEHSSSINLYDMVYRLADSFNNMLALVENK